ncbi:MAG TPA: peptidase M16 [Rhodobacteraceae bacterium]|nr:pitrilysin family protein [Amylibacter sp.]MDG1237253.1 pitrilysin family protein [Amylibacter sp.]MDG1998905.1 pitrilysin family protein [Amylibacter sp.]HAD28550.1 peptidase M16 [Paracoccaceae bacterium]
MSVQIHTLSNGFRIVTENMPGLKSASLGVWVGAGGRHERSEQNGIAHFLEHMAFKGTEKRNSLQIAEAIEDVGGYINAYTSREMTAYYVRVLEPDVPLAMDVISDIVLNSVFDPSEVEIERGVILSEIGQSLDTPDDVIFDWLQEVSYPDQPLGRTILGPEERVRSFTRDDLHAFVKEQYTPDQMVLSAAGSVDHDQLVKMAEAAFGGLQRREARVLQPAVYHGGERRVIKDLEQAHFAMAFETASYRNDEIYTAQVFSLALGGGMSSRLFQEVREKRGLCYTIYAQAGAYVDTGSITIYAGTSGSDVAELSTLCIDELRRAADDMSEAEVNRARVQMKAGMLMGLESPSSRCERLARMVMIWGRVPGLDEVVAKIDAVNTGGVVEYAARLCASGVPSLALYGPVAAAPEVGVLANRLAA